MTAAWDAGRDLGDGSIGADSPDVSWVIGGVTSGDGVWGAGDAAN